MIERLEELAKAATPGPWEAYTECTGRCCWLVREVVPDGEIAEGITYPEASESDAAYIAACDPSTILRLIAVVRAAQTVAQWEEPATIWQSELASLRAALEELK